MSTNGSSPRSPIWLITDHCTIRHARESGHPVHTDFAVLFDKPVFTGSPAFAGDDEALDCQRQLLLRQGGVESPELLELLASGVAFRIVGRVRHVLFRVLDLRGKAAAIE